MLKKTRLAALLLGLGLPLAAFGAPADDVKALLDQGKAAEAYALGKKHPDQLGNPSFDFFYGVAAIDAGHAGEGVLALERYVANFPDNQAARLELGRGYFVLGDDARAREEFDAVLKTNPPAAVQANVQRFMDAIRARESRYKTTAGFFAEAGVGYDTNVNGGVGSPNLTLPVFGAVTLQAGTQTGDSFGHLAAGGNVSVPVAPGVAIFGAAQGDLKLHRTDTAFDQANAGIAGGVSFLQDKNLWRATASYSELQVENDKYRTVTGVSGEVHHQLDELQGLNAALQLAQLRYNGANDVRDAQLRAGTVGYRRAFIGSWQPLFTVSASYGEERNERNRPDLGRKFWGGRLGVALTPRPQWSASAGLSYQESKYDGPDALLLVERRDKYYSLDAGIIYAVNRNWSVRGEYVFSSNDSNIALYEYDRHIIMAKLRYEFK